ncbi:hypothetical protein DP939_19680 [Spongiactinospora rosea]|uniref:Protein kinase domain-containing protein n=1 Tax=Spongiactinospora rosea TaxID=2248750 RepID=A0A366LZA8_9ACTN|nr:serine/threonine-protein kinase [Spongiactinospora rosea]RBQ18699.1 hypothetical protein DP939_19680 [Spongiactinospora rosea]
MDGRKAHIDPLRPGDPPMLGPYRLLGLLGEGGQGTVFLGEAPSGERVAVKLLHARLANDATARERFRREVETARRVARFCTVPVLDADVRNDHPYVVSEFVDGVPLDRLVREHGPLAGGELTRLAAGTATALAAIHRAGVVHRDFKPSNVLVATDGPRVIDFGIARALDMATATTTSSVMGTPAYTSPEQISGHPASPASDVFAWAITMVFAASGRPAFGAQTIPAVLNRILNTPPDLSEVPEGPLRHLLEACLAKDPAERPTAAEALLRLVGPASLPEDPAPAPRASGRRAWIASAAGALALAVAGVIVVPRLPAGGTKGGTKGGTEAGTQASPTPADTPVPTPTGPLRAGPRFGQAGTVYTRHSDEVTAVAAARLQNRDVAISSDRNGRIMVWDLKTSAPMGRQFFVGSEVLAEVEVIDLNGRPTGVLGGYDDAVHVWDLATGETVSVFRGHTSDVTSVAVVRLSGRPVVVSAGPGGTRLSDPATGRQIGGVMLGHSGGVLSTTVAELRGRPVIVTSGVERDGRLMIWDAATQRRIGPAFNRPGSQKLVSSAVAGRPVVAMENEKTITVLDLETGRPLYAPLRGHEAPVSGLAAATLGGHPVLLSSSWDMSVRVWDLAKGVLLGRPLGGAEDWVLDVAAGRVDGRLVAIGAVEDATVRTWWLE